VGFEIDTLNYPLEGSSAIYITPGNGFVSGNNEFGDLAKANYFYNNQTRYITGVLYDFAYATGGNGNIEMALWDDGGLNSSPGSKMAFKNVLFENIGDDIISGNMTYVEFNPPILVSSSFYAGFMLPTTIGDTLVVFSNQDGNTMPGSAWELWSDNVWYPFNSPEAWQLNVALSVFPVLQNTVDIDELSINNSLFTYPNPSSGWYSIDIPEQLNDALQLEVLNASGECILERSFNKEETNIKFDISDYPIGIYLVRLSDTKNSFLQKVVKK